MKCTCSVLSNVTCPPVQNFSTLSHKGIIFKIIIEYEICVLTFATILSETFPILRRIE